MVVYIEWTFQCNTLPNNNILLICLGEQFYELNYYALIWLWYVINFYTKQIIYNYVSDESNGVLAKVACLKLFYKIVGNSVQGRLMHGIFFPWIYNRNMQFRFCKKNNLSHF